MITVQIELCWDSSSFTPVSTFTMQFHSLPQWGDQIRFPQEIREKLQKIVQEYNIFGFSDRISYVREIIHDGSETPILRIGYDPRKMLVKVYPAYKDNTQYKTLYLILPLASLPRQGDNIRVISNYTNEDKQFDKWLYIDHISFDPFGKIHILTCEKAPSAGVRVTNIVDANIKNTVATRVENTVLANIDGTVYVDSERPLAVEIENRGPVEVDVTNRCLYVEGYNTNGY